MSTHVSPRSLRVSLLGAALVCGLLPYATPAGAQGPYRVLDKWKIGGEGGWDYITADAAASRLYLTHGKTVEVIDSKTGKSVGSITGLQGTHGVALDEAGKYGYISDGRANSVVVFERDSLKTVKSIPTGTNPDGVAFEPVTKTVWAFNGRTNNVTVIDTTSQTAVATIPLPGRPEFPQVDGKGTVFVNIEDKNEIVRLDAKTRTATATWALPGCDSPSGLAFDSKGRRLFSVCDGKVMAVTDANSGKQLAKVTIGDGPDAAGYSDMHKLAFSSNGQGTLTVVDASSPDFKVVENLPTAQGARTMAYDDHTDRVYLITAEFGPRPAPTAETPRPRPSVVPGSFMVIVVGR